VITCSIKISVAGKVPAFYYLHGRTNCIHEIFIE